MTEERTYRGLQTALGEIKEATLLCWDDKELFGICTEVFDTLVSAQEKVRLLWELRNQEKFNRAEAAFLEER